MAIPTPLQHISSPVNLLAYTTGVVNIPLPNATLAGNCLILGFQGGNPSPTWTPTDNIGTAWPAASVHVTGAGQEIFIWVKPNIDAGITRITLTPGAGSAQFNSFVVSEFNNCATSSPVDITFSNGAAAAPNVSTGSGTTTGDGDVIWLMGVDQVAADNLNLGAFTPGSGATIIRADRAQGAYAQWQIQPTHGAINPGYTESGTNSTCVAAVAVKSASAGQARPAGIRVFNLCPLIVDPAVSTTTYPYQMPLVGNVMGITWVGELAGVASTNSIASFNTDSAGNGYTHRGNNFGANPDFACGQFWFAENANPSNTLTGQINFTNTQAGRTFHSVAYFYDIVGAATAPFDTNAESSGSQAVTADLTTHSITPTTTNGLVLGCVWIDSHTISGITTPSPGLPDMGIDTASDGNDDLWALTNGFGHFYNATTAAESWVWTVQNNVAPNGVGPWKSGGIALKAAVVVVPGLRLQSQMLM